MQELNKLINFGQEYLACTWY